MMGHIRTARPMGLQGTTGRGWTLQSGGLTLLIVAFGSLLVAFILTLALVSNRAYTNAIDTNIGINATNASVAVYADDATSNSYDATVVLSANGSVSSLVSNIRVVTDGPNGYSLALQSTTANMEGQASSSNVLVPIANGSIANPTAFTSNSCNAWGFATPAAVNNLSRAFDASYSIESSQEIGFSTSRYAAVPTTTTLIHESTSQDETRPYYFAACVNDNMPADIYQATVVWTAYAVNPPEIESDVVVDLDPNMIPVRWNYYSCSYGNGYGNVMDSNPTVSVVPTYPTESSCWVKADPSIHSTNTNDDWYNYTTDNTATRDSYNQPYYINRKMANVVTFTDTTKLATYQAAPVGTPIPEGDIAGYWTYVPRFMYKVENFNYSSTNYPHAFDVILTSADNSTVATKLANIDASLDPATFPQYLTPPAFTFDGQELNGLWFGKYETGGTTTMPIVKPLVSAVAGESGLNIVAFFEMGLLFGNSGLTGSSQSYSASNLHNFANVGGSGGGVNSHMSKNSEWGVLVYYTQSLYGVCSNMNCTSNNAKATSMVTTTYTERVRSSTRLATNSPPHLTGCGPNILNSADETTIGACNPYNTQLGVLASTIHNVYGLYDTAGGSAEPTTGSYASGNGSAANAYAVPNSWSHFTNLPGMLQTDAAVYAPYFDLYPSPPLTGNSSDIVSGKYGLGSSAIISNPNWDIYAGKLGLGHGIFEASGWHGDNSVSIESGYWFVRGGATSYQSGGAGVGVESIHESSSGFSTGSGYGSLRGVVVLLP